MVRIGQAKGGWCQGDQEWVTDCYPRRLAKNETIDDAEILTNGICHRAKFWGQTSRSPEG